ncbi:hypothetical protein JCM19300_1655 [Algibacter lectus]|uniref:Uncharacterized protein n=1 Tax=Algibacter lectus TaxID=221126 RepID=A0A090VIX9_9FLAO|nr:hypothetical protein JCM19300_1655 [Algibacter lectus]
MYGFSSRWLHRLKTKNNAIAAPINSLTFRFFPLMVVGVLVVVKLQKK